MDNPAEIVRQGYNQLAEAYDEWAASVRTEEREKYLCAIADRLPNGARILDVGCGTGLLNTQYLSERFEVVGIDLSERQIGEARTNVMDATFIWADVRDYEFESDSFDAIVSFYCFNHIPRSSYARLLRNFHAWLKIDGYLIASFGIGDTGEWTGEWLGATTYFSSHNERDTLKLISESAFVIENQTVETALEFDDEVSFLWVTARKGAL